MTKEKKRLKDYTWKDLKDKYKRKEFVARLSKIGIVVAVVFAGILVFGAMNGGNDSTDGDEQVSEEKSEETLEEKDITEEEEEISEPNSIESAVDEEKETEESGEEPEFTPEAEQRVLDRYDEYMEESNGLILDITEEDDYNQIYVTLSDDFERLSDNDKQIIVDDLGGKIEGFTRATLYATPASDFLYVYFANSNGELLVDTGHLDMGWEIK